MSVTKYTELCKHVHNLVLGHFHQSKLILRTFSCLQPQAANDPLSIYVDWPLSGISFKFNHTIFGFFVTGFFLPACLTDEDHILVICYSSFFVGYSSTIWIFPMLPIHLTCNIRVDNYNFLMIVNNDVNKHLLNIYVWAKVAISSL